MKNRLRNLALVVALFSAIALGWMERADAARIPLGALTTLNLSTHLDPQFVDLYDLREQISTPSYAATTPRLTFDSSGSVGMGVTPPANGVYQALHIGLYQTLGQQTTGSSQGFLGWNVAGGASDGIYRYRRTGDVASIYEQGSTGQHTFANAVSGTAGANITFVPRFRIDTSGNALVISPGSLGYGTGAGGIVTQATSKSTGVTLNKPAGRITMHGATLASGASVQFTVTNSIVTSIDTIVVTPSGSTNYEAKAVGTFAGSFAIRVTNTSGGSLSEAVELNFAVIKGSAS